MLRQASVRQIRNGEISRKDGYVVVATRFYPRGLRRDLRDEYDGRLAPDRALILDLKAKQRRFGMERGFAESLFEERFELSPEAQARLEELAELSRRRDVFLVCQCPLGHCCHREMLLLLAREKFGAEIGELFRRYDAYLARLGSGAGTRGRGSRGAGG